MRLCILNREMIDPNVLKKTFEQCFYRLPWRMHGIWFFVMMSPIFCKILNLFTLLNICVHPIRMSIFYIDLL
jgi:hypothetical protein